MRLLAVEDSISESPVVVLGYQLPVLVVKGEKVLQDRLHLRIRYSKIIHSFERSFDMRIWCHAFYANKALQRLSKTQTQADQHYKTKKPSKRD